LYVSRGDGTRVGWWDLIANNGHVENDIHLEELRRAAQRWLAEHDDSERDAVVTAETTLERSWVDLAQNTAGAEARARAEQARDAAPLRTFVARALGVHTDERAWRLGAEGETKVGAQFGKLLKKDPRWQVIHSIPVGTRGSDIDHLIVGPGGVFTANTKNHPKAKIWVGGDTVMVNGQRQPYVRNARHEAARASKLLSQACGWQVRVEGFVIVVNADDLKIETPPADVHVMWRRQAVRWLRRRDEVLDQASLESIFEAARRSTTWK
jgi:hypothetical protein